MILYDRETGAELQRFGEDGVAYEHTAWKVGFSPDGQQIFSIGDGSPVALLWGR